MTPLMHHAALALLAILGSTPPGDQAKLPDTPAGKIAAAYLAAFNDGADAALVKFEQDYRVAAKLKETGAAERASRIKEMRANFGTLVVEGIKPAGDGSFRALLKGSKGAAVEMHFVPAKGDATKLDFIEVTTFGSQPRALTAVERAAAVEGAAKAMESGYVFPETGAKMAATVREKLKAGGYDDSKDDIALARAVTADFLAVSHDKHIGMAVQPPPEPDQRQSIAGPSQEEMARENYGFRKVERLAGNIGYIKFDIFLPDDAAKETALAALRFVSHCDAMVFDLRQNGGGSPEMIRFLTSSLFDQPTLLNQMMDRDGTVVEEFATLADFPGPRFSASTPIFVLTSNRTFSGAEEFSYNLKALKRATIVGEVTGGGAHPVRRERIGEGFALRVPYMRAHNPITGTNWEGTGVTPDVEVPADQALEKALELARASLAAKRPSPGGAGARPGG